ncbi:hypothetical protein HK102_005219, partial [Quaeritorhiza haematococci]
MVAAAPDDVVSMTSPPTLTHPMQLLPTPPHTAPETPSTQQPESPDNHSPLTPVPFTPTSPFLAPPAFDSSILSDDEGEGSVFGDFTEPLDTVGETATPEHLRLKLTQLPDLVLRRVFTYVEKPEQLVQTCRLFHTLGKSATVKRDWLFHRPSLFSSFAKHPWERQKQQSSFPASLFNERLCILLLKLSKRLLAFQPADKARPVADGPTVRRIVLCMWGVAVHCNYVDVLRVLLSRSILAQLITPLAFQVALQKAIDWDKTRLVALLVDHAKSGQDFGLLGDDEESVRCRANLIKKIAEKGSIRSLMALINVPDRKFQLVRNSQLRRALSTLRIAADNNNWKLVRALMYPILWEDMAADWTHVLQGAVRSSRADMAEALLDLGFRRAKGHDMPPNVKLFIPPAEASIVASADENTSTAFSPPSSSSASITGEPQRRKRWPSANFVQGWSKAAAEATRSSCSLLRIVLKWGLKWEGKDEASLLSVNLGEDDASGMPKSPRSKRRANPYVSDYDDYAEEFGDDDFPPLDESEDFSSDSSESDPESSSSASENEDTATQADRKKKKPRQRCVIQVPILQRAWKSGKPEHLKLLLSCDLYFDGSRRSVLARALNIAVKRDQKSVSTHFIKLVLDAGVDVSNESSTDALLHLFRNGHVEAVRAMIDGGVSFGTSCLGINNAIRDLLMEPANPDETCETLLTVLLSAFAPSSPVLIEALQCGYRHLLVCAAERSRLGSLRLLLKTLEGVVEPEITKTAFTKALKQGNLEVCNELMILGTNMYRFEIIELVQLALKKTNETSGKPVKVVPSVGGMRSGLVLPGFSDMKGTWLSSSASSSSPLLLAASTDTDSARASPWTKTGIPSPQPPKLETVLAALEKIPKKTLEALEYLMEKARGYEGGWEMVRSMISFSARRGYVDALRVLIERSPSILSDYYTRFGQMLGTEEEPNKEKVAFTQTPSIEAPNPDTTNTTTADPVTTTPTSPPPATVARVLPKTASEAHKALQLHLCDLILESCHMDYKIFQTRLGSAPSWNLYMISMEDLRGAVVRVLMDAVNDDVRREVESGKQILQVEGGYGEVQTQGNDAAEGVQTTTKSSKPSTG